MGLRYGIWFGSHAALPLLLWAVMTLLMSTLPVNDGGAPLYTDALFYVLPGVALGLMQWAILTRWFRFCSLWWILATAVGIVASVLFMWWFMLAPGLTIGLAQYGLHKIRWRRFASLWIPASGLGWATGFLGGAILRENLPSGLFLDAVPACMGGVGYGAATALALLALDWLNPQKQPPALSGGPKCKCLGRFSRPPGLAPDDSS